MSTPQRPTSSKGSASTSRGANQPAPRPSPGGSGATTTPAPRPAPGGSGAANSPAARPSSRGGSPRRVATAEGPEGTGEVHMVLRRQYITYANKNMYYRKYDPKTKTFGKWEPVADKFEAQKSDGLKTLSVVRQTQAPPKGPHWSLFVVENDSDKGAGRVWQVWGDHQCMVYYHTPASKLVPLLHSDSYQDHHPLNTRLTKAQEAIVDRVCNTIPPPSAPTPRDIKDNCRTWVIKVLKELIKQGIVKKEDVDKIEQLQGPAASGQGCGTNCP